MGITSEHLIKFLGNTVFHWSSGILVYLYLYNRPNFKPDSTLIKTLLGYNGVRIFFKLLGYIFSEKKGLHGNGKRYKLKDKVVLVTGAANGLGKLITHNLASKGATIAAVDIAPLKYKLDNVHYFQCDISKSENIIKTINKIVSKLGAPTILINNAGTVRPAFTIDKFEDKDVDLTLRVNLDAPIYFTKHCLPYMIQQKEGHIVNIASLAAHSSVSQLGCYCVSKAGLMSFNESLLNDLLTHYKDCSIKTTLVLPGILNTELFKNAKTPSRFLLPNQDAKELSDMIVEELEVHRHKEIYTPKYVNLVPWFRVFNLTFRRFMHSLIGADAAMYNFNAK